MSSQQRRKSLRPQSCDTKMPLIEKNQPQSTRTQRRRTSIRTLIQQVDTTINTINKTNLQAEQTKKNIVDQQVKIQKNIFQIDRYMDYRNSHLTDEQYKDLKHKNFQEDAILPEINLIPESLKEELEAEKREKQKQLPRPRSSNFFDRNYINIVQNCKQLPNQNHILKRLHPLPTHQVCKRRSCNNNLQQQIESLQNKHRKTNSVFTNQPFLQEPQDQQQYNIQLCKQHLEMEQERQPKVICYKSVKGGKLVKIDYEKLRKQQQEFCEKRQKKRNSSANIPKNRRFQF